MANAWGSSWGVSWAVSWGTSAVVTRLPVILLTNNAQRNLESVGSAQRSVNAGSAVQRNVELTSDAEAGA